MTVRRTITGVVAFAAALTLAAGCSSPTTSGQASTATVTAGTQAAQAATVTVTAKPAPAATVTVTASPTAAAAPPSETAAAPPADPNAAVKVGASVPYEDSRGQGIATLHSAEWTTEDEFGSPPEQGAFLVLDVSIKSVSGKATGTNPFDWEVKDADGRVYDSTFTAPDPSMSVTDMAPGETVRGNLEFDLPKGTSTVRLISGLRGTPLAVWTVK